LPPQSRLRQLDANDPLELLGIGGVQLERCRFVPRADAAQQLQERSLSRHGFCPLEFGSLVERKRLSKAALVE
jgi:hypothetical protein